MARPSRVPQRDRKVQPPRPPNAWILYRSDQFKKIRETGSRLSQAAVSKIISEMWKHETDDVKRYYEQEAETKKAQHQELYPDYRFCPKRKEGRQRRKKSKGSEVDADADDDDNDDDGVPPSMPTFPSMPYPQPPPQTLLVPGYHHNMIMPQPFMVPYLPDVRYGPGGPSPPMSAAPSPAPHVTSQSPQQPDSMPSSSSSPSVRPSSSSESQASSSSSQPPANATYLPPLPNSHHPSPNPYATLPLSTLLFQDSASGEQSLASPRPQLRSTENTVTLAAPVWSNISALLPSPHSQNLEEVVNVTNQTQNVAEYQQVTTPGPSFDSLQGLLSRTAENGVFNLSNIESSALLTYPHGDLEVAMGPQASAIDYCDDLFTDFDFDEFQRQMDSLTEGSSSSAFVAPHPFEEDLRSLFQTANNPEIQAYTAARQRQPSEFTQDMMNFLNFEAAENSTEDTSSAIPPVPVPTTVTPQQVRFQSPQDAPAMPIFTQMTNTPTVASGSSYVPPSGAVYSSTRRVAGSWKPSFSNPRFQMDESVPSWNL